MGFGRGSSVVLPLSSNKLLTGMVADCRLGHSLRTHTLISGGFPRAEEHKGCPVQKLPGTQRRGGTDRLGDSPNSAPCPSPELGRPSGTFCWTSWSQTGRIPFVSSFKHPQIKASWGKAANAPIMTLTRTDTPVGRIPTRAVQGRDNVFFQALARLCLPIESK